MNDSSGKEPTLSTDQEASGSPKGQQLLCSRGHQLLTLVGITFVFFEIIFIDLYSDKFWFSLNIEWLGLPTILIAGVVAHIILCLGETKFATMWLRFFARENPPVVYRKWVSVDDSGITFGLHHIKFDVMDELALTWLGNMHIKSRALCGGTKLYPDIVLRFPFGVALQEDQKRLIELIRSHHPNIAINQRLTKRLESPIVKGQNAVQFIGAAMMALLLLDVGHNSFHWLEMLKHYHLARQYALDGKPDDAKRELEIADNLRAHEIPFSYANNAFLKKGVSGAGVLQARSDALMDMHRYDEAIADSRKAVETVPENFRMHLHLARQLDKAGKTKEADEEVQLAIAKHKDSFLPRLYLISSLWQQEKPQAARTTYEAALEKLSERFFGEEPFWPPGNNRYVADGYYESDIRYIYDRLLNYKKNPH